PIGLGRSVVMTCSGFTGRGFCRGGPLGCSESARRVLQNFTTINLAPRNAMAEWRPKSDKAPWKGCKGLGGELTGNVKDAQMSNLEMLSAKGRDYEDLDGSDLARQVRQHGP